MIDRRERDKPAQITFAEDPRAPAGQRLRELVTGDLRPAQPVVLSYDPFRIVPASESYLFGNPAQPVTAFVAYRLGGEAASEILEATGGIAERPDRDPSGQGSMLKAEFDVPADAEAVHVWFSYRSGSGETLFDNDGGTNYHFGFPSRDLTLQSATITGASRALSVSVSAKSQVEKIEIAYHLSVDPEDKVTWVQLEKKPESDELGRSIWTVSGGSIPSGAVVRFEIYYWIGGLRFKDDNSGHRYFAPQPAAVKLPPPPAGLAEAAMKWK